MHPGDSLHALGLFKTTGGTADQTQINEDRRDLGLASGAAAGCRRPLTLCHSFIIG